MAVFTEPPAVVTGQTMTATNWNSWVRTNFQAVWVWANAGDLAYASTANQLSRLGIGTANKILKSTGSAPAWEGMSGARVSRGSGQSIPNATYTAATFTTKEFDTGAFWKVGSPSRLTVSRTGYYLIGGKIGWETNSNGMREVKVYRNGGISGDSASAIAHTGVATRQVLCLLVYATAGDYFELYLWQNSSDPLNHGGDVSSFWILDVGP